MSKQNLQTTDSKLSSSLKELEPNVHLLHLSTIRQLNNSRAGTASTKTKSEVRGGGKKPWKQKGTGRARAGSIRSPLWVGGGIIFGPKPRDFSCDIPKKAGKLAIAHALASKAEETVVIKTLPEVKDSKTKNFISAMKSSNLMNLPVLIIAQRDEANFAEVKRASKNVQGVCLTDKNGIGVYEILKAKTIIITEKASAELESKLKTVLTGTKKEKKVVSKKGSKAGK